MSWLESVFSCGSPEFVSDPAPRLGQRVSVRLRLYETAPVRGVVLRWLRNGAECLSEARPCRRERGLVWYEAELPVTEPRMQYHFCLAAEGGVLFYTQRGLTAYPPERTWDFVLLCAPKQPAWVRDAVFYQIFPDRFCSGDPANAVRTGEYVLDGHPCVLREHWEDEPWEYDRGFCLDFHGGDLEGIRQKLPYLQALGVTALYLNPIFLAPSVHRYDCADYFTVDPHLGGDEALARLSAAVHAAGMKLIVDISINHTGTEHRWFNRGCLYAPPEVGAYHNPDAPERAFYFFGEGSRYEGWYGLPNLPVLNYTSEALRRRVWRDPDSVLRKWLRPPYSIDGWRFDVADVFGRRDGLQLSDELWPEICAAIREENPEAYILAEDWGDCAFRLQGDLWDSAMNYFGCGRIIRSFLGEQDFFLGRSPLLRQTRMDLSAEDVKQSVLRHLAKLPFSVQSCQFNLFDSHDIGRLHNNPAISFDAWRCAAIFQFLLPGAASIYYGDEAGIGGHIRTNEGCRWPMPWSRALEEDPHYRVYAALCAAKKAHPALREGGLQFPAAEGKVLALARTLDRDWVLGVLSMEGEERTVRIPLGALGAERLPERDLFGAPLSAAAQPDGSILLRVPPRSGLLICAQEAVSR